MSNEGKYKTQRERQHKILRLLTEHGPMSTGAIVSALYSEQVMYDMPKYNSVTRCLRRMKGNGLIIKVVGQTMWDKAKE